MANKNQQYFRRELKAGVPETIDFGARFVFIEKGQNITVIADNNRISNKRKGDKVTFDQPVNSISFESKMSQVIEFTAGFGDFDRVIVEGELSISESIKTTAIDSNSLPISIHKYIGIENLDHIDFNIGDKFYTGENLQALDQGFIGGGFYLDDEFYVLTTNNIYKYNEDGATVFKKLIRSEGLDKNLGRDAVNDTAWPIYAAFVIGRWLYGIWPHGIVSVDIESGTINDVVFNDETRLHGSGGGFYYNGTIYASKYNENGFRRYSLGGGSISDLSFESVANLGGIFSFDYSNDSLYVSGYGSSLFNKLTIDDLAPTGDVISFSGAWKRSCVFRDDLNVAHCSDGLGYSAVVLNDVSYSAKLFIQDGNNESTRKKFYIQGDFSFMSRSTGTVLSGPIASAVLQGIKSGGWGDYAYLDYIVSLEYSDGKNRYKKSAGTATWAYRGLRDYGELLLGSNVSIELMPEFLTDAY